MRLAWTFKPLTRIAAVRSFNQANTEREVVVLEVCNVQMKSTVTTIMVAAAEAISAQPFQIIHDDLYW